MIAICVDDEPILANWLYKTVSASPDIVHAEKFTDENAALDYAKENPFDIVFLDIELHTTDGINVAEQFRALHPTCGIVFCTGHPDYAIDAIKRVNVDGYLLKPISQENVQREIDRFKTRYQETHTLLTIDFFGGINVFSRDGKPICFRRKKTEQLLALLVQENGKSISVRELCEKLWDDSRQSEYLYKKNENYLTQLLSDLRHTLTEFGAPDVLKKDYDGYSIRMPLINIKNQTRVSTTLD